uniref:C-type lectin domain family 12 member B-like n=1 Tax=Doryrhamphus excisus TaxID=161450 RepID=UPI0025AEB57C|nr:C-type lectin domain family 12 member B-like [Doryrhamphus excisus]
MSKGQMSELDLKVGFGTPNSENNADMETSGHNSKPASYVILCRAATASLVILAVVLLIVDIHLAIKYVMLHDTNQLPNDEAIEKDLMKLEESYQHAVGNITNAKRQLYYVMERQIQTNWEFEHQNRRTRDYEVQIDEITKDVVHLKSYLPMIEGGCRHCPLGWSLINSVCYYFALSQSVGLKSWQEAREFCQLYGGDLIIIDSKDKQNATMNYLRSHAGTSSDNFWIGLTWFQQERLWRWADGRDLVEGFWQVRASNNYGHQQCVALYNRENFFTAWISIECDFQSKWICEKAPSNNP